MTLTVSRGLSACLMALAALAASLSPAPAQDRRVPASAAELQMSFAPIVKRVAPAVVNVYAARAVVRQNPLFDDPIFRRFFGMPGGPGGPGQGPSDRVSSLGSGVIVDPAGLVVTNNHVIEGANEIKISLADRSEYEAEVVLRDQRSDLAVLRVKGRGARFPAIEFADSDAAQVGDIVLAIGNPFAVGQTVTQGIISAVARTQVGITDYQFFIQTDAAINPGNSGGALVDMSGKLVGINTAIFSRSGGSMGIGFAIPANMVRVVAASAQGGGTAVKRPWLGARLQTVTPDIAESLNLKRPAGALVGTVTGGSPAARAGLRTGDLVVSVDGVAVDDANAFDYRFATKAIGGEAKVGIVRNGREMTVTVGLETAPELPLDDVTIQSRSPFMGAHVSNISPALADELKLDMSSDGVVILDVAPGSAAQSLGFQRGDVILVVNDVKITRTRDLEQVTARPSRVWRVTARRGGQQMTFMLGG